MTQFIELTGRTEADAIAQALVQLGLERDDIRVEVLERAKTGFLGFGSKPAKIRVSYAEKTEEVNLYADIKAEEAQEQVVGSTTAVDMPEPLQEEHHLESTQAIDAQKLATMLDQAASTVVPAGDIPLEEEELSPEEGNPLEEATTSKDFSPSFFGSSPFPVVETSSEPEVTSDSMATQESQEAPESQESSEVEVVTVYQSKGEDGNPDQDTSTPATQTEENSEKTEDSPEKTKKLSKKERENLTSEEQEALTAEITRFLEGLMVHMEVTATPSVTYKGLTVEVRLEGEGLATLIGKRGETLDSIQQITGYVIMRTCKKRIKLFLDAENYRAKREETLIKLAHKVAGEAVKNKRNVPLEPMNAYERHIIHEALSEHPNVFTYSTGSEPNRCTVVAVQGRKSHYKKNKNNKR